LTELSDCESECESELPDGRADALPSECVPLLTKVSAGVVGGRADVWPFTCLVVELRTLRRSEWVGRTSVSYRRRERLSLVAASSCRTSRCRSDAVACRRSCRPYLTRDVTRSTASLEPPSSRFPDPVSQTDTAVGIGSCFDGVSPGASSSSSESHISYFFPLFNSFSALGAILLLNLTSVS